MTPFKPNPDYPWLLEAEFSTVEELYPFLTRTNPIWGSEPECKWIFRGQYDSWPILPAAWRDSGAAAENIKRIRDPYIEKTIDIIANSDLQSQEYGPFKNIFNRNTPPEIRVDHAENTATTLCTVAAETELVKWFVRFADMTGLPIPESELPRESSQIITSGVMYNDFNTPDGSINPKKSVGSEWWFDWLPQEVHGLAQHYGIPTRLIDWTYDLKAAAFFASKGEFMPDRLSDFIEIYALNQENLHMQHTPGGYDNGKLNTMPKTEQQFFLAQTRLWTLTCRRSRNENLHAQHGLFTYARGAERFYMAYGRWPTLVDILDLRWKLAYDGNKPPLLCRLRLPVNLANDLRVALYKDGVSPAHMMPGFGNIWETISWRLSQADI
jgi:FRG domain-containing protein